MPVLPAPGLTRCPGRTGHCGGLLFADGDEDGTYTCVSGHGPWWPYGYTPIDRPKSGQTEPGHNLALRRHYAAKRKAAEGR